MSKITIAVIGGGAAGFMGAISAKTHFPEARVVILEKNHSVLNKVRISGGGRCNVTHDHSKSIAQLLKGYPRGEKFLRQVFEVFDHKQTVAWFEQKGVSLKTEADGRMFPSTDESETIVNCLLTSAQQLGIEIWTSSGVSKVNSVETSQRTEFVIELLSGDKLIADRLLIASGGNPNLAAYQWINDLQHPITPPVPSLFTFNVPQHFLSDLQGVSSQQAKVRIAKTKLEQDGPLLITHWGFSGPSVLKLSAWAARELAEKNYEFSIAINWYNQPDEKIKEELQHFKLLHSAKLVHTLAYGGLPHRLWKAFLQQAQIPETLRWADLSNKSFNRLVESLVHGTFEVKGKTTFKEEFVTCGGVQLSQINAKTLESTQCKGLFFAGEVLDIDGITGGYNFQSAWSTGWVAGMNIGLD